MDSSNAFTPWAKILDLGRSRLPITQQIADELQFVNALSHIPGHGGFTFATI
jgi:hypothetical protein